MESTPEVVQEFKTELNTLFHARLPISRAKMTAVTKKAMKAAKFYKHIVMIVEKFIFKASSDHKLPGLYVIDSIIRQSRHQFVGPKEVYGPRFAKNFEKTFINLYDCSDEDQPKIVRVLNLWKTNNIYPVEILQPLIDLAPPTAIPDEPINNVTSPQEQPSSTQIAPEEGNSKGSPATAILAQNQEQIDSLLQQQQQQLESLIQAGAGQPMLSLLLDKAQHLQELQSIQQKLITDNSSSNIDSAVEDPPPPPLPPQTQTQALVPNAKGSKNSMSKLSEFSKALLDDFDYSSDEDEGNPAHLGPPLPRDSPTPMLSSDFPPSNDTQSATDFIEELNRQFTQQNKEGKPPGMGPPPLPNENPTHPYPGEWMGPPPPPDVDYHPPPPRPPHQRWSDHWSPPHSHGPHPPRGPHPPHHPPHESHPPHYFSDIPPPHLHPPPPPPPPGHPRNYPPPGPHPPMHGRFSPPPPHRSSGGHSPLPFPRDRSPGPFRRERHPRSPPFRGGGRRSRSPPFRGGRSPPHRGRSPMYRGGRTPPYRGRSPPLRSRSPPLRSRSPPSRRGSHDDHRDRSRRGRDPLSPDRSESRRVHPTPKPDHTTVCSNTVWIGHLNKSVTMEQIQEAVQEYGPIKSLDHVVARGCAYVVMENRKDAVRAVDRLTITGQKSKVAWAPGKGVKDKAYNEYWDADRGISYIPHTVLGSTGILVEKLGEGGWVDMATVKAAPPTNNDNAVDMAIDE